MAPTSFYLSPKSWIRGGKLGQLLTIECVCVCVFVLVIPWLHDYTTVQLLYRYMWYIGFVIHGVVSWTVRWGVLWVFASGGVFHVTGISLCSWVFWSHF